MKRLLSLIAVVVALSAQAQGTYEAITSFSSTNPPVLGTLEGTAGWTFQPSTNLQITALGALNPVVTGSGTIFVGLWNAAGTLLASNAITATSALTGDSRFEPIVPIMLAPLQTYHLGAFASAGTIGFSLVDLLAGDTIVASPWVNLIGAATANNTFSFPTGSAEDIGLFYMAPNFQFSLVPEPSVVSLAVVGGVMWLLRRRSAI